MLTSYPLGARRLITKNNAIPLAMVLSNAKVIPPRRAGLSFRFYWGVAAIRYPRSSIVVYLAAALREVRDLPKLDIFSLSGVSCG